MASRYARQISTTLASRLAEMSEERPEKKLDLSDEIDVARLMLEKALQKWDQVQQMEDASIDLRVLAQGALRAAIENVSDVATRQATIIARLQSVLTGRQIGYFVAQIGSLIDKVVQDPDQRALIHEGLASLELLPNNVDSNVIIRADD